MFSTIVINCDKVRVWGDASSIILLAKATLLRIACDNAKIMMTESTYHEATRKRRGRMQK